MLSRAQQGTTAAFSKMSVNTAEASRVAESAHFIVPYSLYGIHKVKLVAGDSVISTAAASKLKELSTRKAVYNWMDANNMEHPLYIQKCIQFFEESWDYFITDLGMFAPSSSGFSQIFSQPAVKGKYTVEIAHIGALPDWNIEVYALTFPPGHGNNIILDNDFLWSDSYGTYRPIRSVYNEVNPPLIIDYSEEWEKGIRVTAYHEFYHAIQYTYTPYPASYHYWYEASAVGMEERLGPDINDYLQYLPDLMKNHSTFSLNDPYLYQENETYAEGIWHSFLTTELGIDFDVEVWSSLSKNNDPDAALNKVMIERGHNIKDLYAKFTRPLMYSQRASECPFPIFTTDLDLWPVIMPKLFNPNKTLSFSLPTLTFEVIETANITGNIQKKVTVVNGTGITVTTVNGRDTASLKIPNEKTSVFLLNLPKNNSDDNFVMFSNGSWNKIASITFDAASLVQDELLSAFPNPLYFENSFRNLRFTKPIGNTDTLLVSIFSEFGALVKSLIFPPEETGWNWDLKNEAGDPVEAGIYYYKTNGQQLSPILLIAGSADDTF